MKIMSTAFTAAAHLVRRLHLNQRRTHDYADHVVAPTRNNAASEIAKLARHSENHRA